MTWAQPTGSNPIEPIVEMLNKRQYAEAVPLMELLLSDDPDDTAILYNLGMVYSDRGEWEKSLACLNRLMELEPKNINGRVALGTAFDAARQYRARSGRTAARGCRRPGQPLGAEESRRGFGEDGAQWKRALPICGRRPSWIPRTP